MNSLKLIIKNNIYKKDLSYYDGIIQIVEDYIEDKPDVCIESCKALIEGISKTILCSLNNSVRVEDIEAMTLQQLYKKAIEEVDKYNDDFETELASRFGNIVQVIGTYRNKRGDISHGRPVPKIIESDKYLSKLIRDLTDSFLEYLLKHYFDIEISNEYLKYDKLSDYNTYLNSTLGVNFQMKKITYSELLFENDFDMYKEIYYDEYYPNLNILESNDKENLGNLIFYLQKIKESNPELEIKRKVEFIEKETEELYVKDGYVAEGYAKQLNINEAKNINKLHLFVVEHNLNFEKTRVLIDEKLSINKEPLREEILKISDLKISLSERGKVFNDLKIKIDEFIKTLE